MALAMKMGKLGPQQAQMMQQIAKAKAFDALWASDGVDEEDVTRSFYEYRLSETEEFKAIMTRSQQLTQQYMQAEMQKIQQMMAQMGGQGMRPGGPGGPGGMPMGGMGAGPPMGMPPGGMPQRGPPAQAQAPPA